MINPWFSTMLLALVATEVFTLCMLKTSLGLTAMLTATPLFRSRISPNENLFVSPKPRPLTEQELARILLERTGTLPTSHRRAT